ncbi:hypothetical protein ACFYM0_23690 [Streptomyces sp. NPDC006487]|uniref:hypothetical protein n=1 Tax=Streptomyces sp. NPDC006487 TaxID=3364748 RepID=UPI003689390D
MGKLFTARIIAALATAATLIGLPPAEAHAGAIGSTPVTGFDYQVGGVTMKVPTGCMFTHIVRGDGKATARRSLTRTPASTAGSSAPSTPASATGASTSPTRTPTTRPTAPPAARRTECEIHPMRDNAPQTLPRYGRACAHLHVNGVRRVSQCHHITK